MHQITRRVASILAAMSLASIASGCIVGQTKPSVTRLEAPVQPAKVHGSFRSDRDRRTPY